MLSDVMTTEKVWELLNTIPDPEIPVISIVELGVVRDVTVSGDHVDIIITPTYTGCPATNFFEKDIHTELTKAGFQTIRITHQYNPPWSTDLISDESREKLRQYGIAPPVGKSTDKNFILGKESVIACPQCKSKNTKMISQFGSTACKSLYQCNDCLETFDYFKCI